MAYGSCKMHLQPCFELEAEGFVDHIFGGNSVVLKCLRVDLGVGDIALKWFLISQTSEGDGRRRGG